MLIGYAMAQKAVYIPLILGFACIIAFICREVYVAKLRSRASKVIAPVTIPQEEDDDNMLEKLLEEDAAESDKKSNRISVQPPIKVKKAQVIPVDQVVHKEISMKKSFSNLKAAIESQKDSPEHFDNSVKHFLAKDGEGEGDNDDDDIVIYGQKEKEKNIFAGPLKTIQEHHEDSRGVPNLQLLSHKQRTTSIKTNISPKHHQSNIVVKSEAKDQFHLISEPSFVNERLIDQLGDLTLHEILSAKKKGPDIGTFEQRDKEANR